MIAVKSDNEKDRETFVAKQAAYYIARILKSDMTLGIAWGLYYEKND